MTGHIVCELCRRPHRPATVQCDGCGHTLGQPMDREALGRQLPPLRWQIALGTVALVLMNIFGFGGAAFIALVSPTVGWLVFSVYRYRQVSHVLRRNVSWKEFD